ncbi:MAG TPA: pyridoxal 5'-phosphate synthase glutaminase subunit PdxT [Candidatus Polarisedimenticolia bacterium]
MSATGDGRPIGVLGLQGDFEAHRRAFEEIGVPARVVRFAGELAAISGLVIPGGESTTLIKLMLDVGFIEPLRLFHAEGRPLFGTCAGAILLAAKVTNPDQFSLGLIDIDIERNAYGRQVESFETARGRVEEPLDSSPFGLPGDSMDLVLIRAPRIRRYGPQVRVLVRHVPASGDPEPVLVRQGNVLAGTFHPELGPERRIHGYFARMARLDAVAA